MKMVEQELELMLIVCRGIDPRDGTFFDTPVDLALEAARANYIAALRALGTGLAPATAKQNPLLDQPNQGQPWSLTDDAALKEMWASGSNASDAGRALGRGDGAIIARLVFLRVFESRSIARRVDASRRVPATRARKFARRLQGVKVFHGSAWS